VGVDERLKHGVRIAMDVDELRLREHLQEEFQAARVGRRLHDERFAVLERELLEEAAERRLPRFDGLGGGAAAPASRILQRRWPDSPTHRSFNTRRAGFCSKMLDCDPMRGQRGPFRRGLTRFCTDLVEPVGGVFSLGGRVEATSCLWDLAWLRRRGRVAFSRQGAKPQREQGGEEE